MCHDFLVSCIEESRKTTRSEGDSLEESLDPRLYTMGGRIYIVYWNSYAGGRMVLLTQGFTTVLFMLQTERICYIWQSDILFIGI